ESSHESSSPRERSNAMIGQGRKRWSMSGATILARSGDRKSSPMKSLTHVVYECACAVSAHGSFVRDRPASRATAVNIAPPKLPPETLEMANKCGTNDESRSSAAARLSAVQYAARKPPPEAATRIIGTIGLLFAAPRAATH